MQRIAIVGSGIAGLGTAWLLRDMADITVFEARAEPGGHVRTVMHGEQPVDTGFIVLNDRNYPYFNAFLNELGVAHQDSDMSFGVSIGDGAIEWAGDSLGAMFAQPGLALDWRHWHMLADIVRFNRQAKKLLVAGDCPDISLGRFLDKHRYSEAFAARYLLPMAAAIWSTPTAGMRDFPLASFLRFFGNHGLLDLANRPQWATVVGGSHSYVKKMQALLGKRLRCDTPVQAVTRLADGVSLTTGEGKTETFDRIVFACHADTTRAIIADMDADERAILGAFDFQPNRAVLHSDASLMPRRRAVWSSWNYQADRARLSDQRVAVTYWMNRLQNIDGPQQYFVSLNPLREPEPDKIIAEIDYDHPVFDGGAIAAQQRLPEIQGRHRSWFAGAWTGFGFHEDGLASATRVAEGLGVRAPWLT
ncbi:MAG: FAD-dependent oxidoreductase [Salinisphaera sp.]|jgi:predicted NAD/FAD-binding protein|nr:FAD-dependent oxidoreductase [Salinisphaera sp.]